MSEIQQKSRSYLQHGRRHKIGGSDPILGLGQVPFATLRTRTPLPTVPGDNATHYISMQDGSTGFFETSDDTIFENALGISSASSAYGIKCLQNGTYIVRENYFFTGGTAGVKITGYHTLNGGNTVSNFQFGRTATLVGDTWDQGSGGPHTFFEEWTDATAGNPAPLYINPYVVNASGSDVHVDVQTMVIYLGEYAGGNL